MHLYLYHTPLGACSNQATILKPSLPHQFGNTAVNDWVITDGPGRGAKVVARAKGIHIQTAKDGNNYYVSFNMVFEDCSGFKGSTLQVMGPIVEHGEWAIVGGTGEFTLAQGIIYKTFYQQHKDGNIMELDIHALYTPMARSQSQLCTRTDVQSRNVWALGK